ncbi:MAG: hypothetical protein UU47_C0026G0005 [candidate division TM6 bacterium GW2011_GWE2_41_16]|nr:MAG: hypothetical protein UU47_C0026G0005 [candidate division TM6 bacterium GW2011_GWE2_41_16]
MKRLMMLILACVCVCSRVIANTELKKFNQDVKKLGSVQVEVFKNNITSHVSIPLTKETNTIQKLKDHFSKTYSETNTHGFLLYRDSGKGFAKPQGSDRIKLGEKLYFFNEKESPDYKKITSK